jgi:hypothetical protein
MRRTAFHLRTCLVLLAWFAQLCLPLAHAAVMAAPNSQMAGWCGNPLSSAAFQAYLADLPDELRQGLDESGAGAHALDACAEFCAVGALPAPPATAPATLALRAAGLEPAPLPPLPPAISEPARRPPSQGPPSIG